jgi:hypothetical protein
MPVMLRAGDEADRWLAGDARTAATLQRPLPDALMREIETPAPPPAPTQATLF